MTVPPGWPAASFAEATAALTRPGSPYAIEEIVIRGQPTRIWSHAPPTLRHLFGIARGFGDLPFLVYRDERASFEGFARAAVALSHALIEAGVRPGDRVAVAMRNLPEWPVCFYGALLAGAVAAPLNAWWTGPELFYAVDDCGAAVLIADGERLDRLAPHLPTLPNLRRILLTRPAGAAADARVEPLSGAIGPTGAWSGLPELPLPDVAIDPEDDATIFYTSGTTGRPKGAVGTHRAAASTCMAHSYSVARSCLRRGDPLPVPDPAAPQRASLLAIPLFHVTACHSTLGTAMLRGQKIVLMHRWDVETGLDLIDAERCTGAGGVPFIAWELATRAAAAGRPLPSLEGVFYGGAPAAADLVRALKASFPSAQPATGWGMTETSATFTHHIGEEYENRPDSCGPPLPVCDARIVGPDGAALPPGEVGELQARGPNVVRGYWNKPDAAAAKFVDGWLRTGDLARADAEGFITIVDRMDDMLIRGGENIYCAEVENALFAHPAVIDAVVLPVPHPTLGEEPGAIVTLATGATADAAELRRFVAGRIAAFKVPVKVVMWDGMLPRNAAGKILRRELKGALAG